MADKSYTSFLVVLVTLVSGWGAIELQAQPSPQPGPQAKPTESSQTGDYSHLGADACILCHSPETGPDATAIFATPHASRTDPSAPFADLQCETCHGPGQAHARSQRGGGDVTPAVMFGVRAQTPAAEQNSICLGCHESHGRLGWFGSRHEAESVPCAACHRIHSETDPVFDPLAQQQACFSCHQERESDTWRNSNHPLRFGEMDCGSCHDPHAGDNDFLLIEASIVETCYTCHAEKRGPFLWEHAPASEDCTLCHRPHGSNHDAMLKRRPPSLCQQCHSPAEHPGLAYTAESTQDDFENRFLLGRACLNCHSQVHGSNHPSGVTMDR